MYSFEYNVVNDIVICLDVFIWCMDKYSIYEWNGGVYMLCFGIICGFWVLIFMVLGCGWFRVYMIYFY